ERGGGFGRGAGGSEREPWRLQEALHLRRQEMISDVGDVADRRHTLSGDLEAGEEVGERVVVELREFGRGSAGRKPVGQGRKSPALAVITCLIAGLAARLDGG